ncbi:hypothetical protein HMPREF0541_02334 [Lacticaseibacillus rhamnosus ATCC 21052]|nr:hypothetical protein HMPREF0541_02334 [Lacticaseibacillus rhamnosus ATCC 21052]
MFFLGLDEIRILGYFFAFLILAPPEKMVKKNTLTIQSVCLDHKFN